jgi:nucleotide-binding universal stress UspA family protein
MLVTMVVGLAFLFGAVAQALHFEAVLGAFVLGLVVGQIRRIPHAVVRDIESVGLSVFAPIFFAVAGLKVDVLALTEPRLLWVTALVVSIACLGKVVGTYLGARLIGGAPHWNALAFGAGLNARGAMEILIATIGLRLGILSTDIFSVIVVMAIATSLIAPPSLRYVLRRVEPDDDEKARLAREAIEKTRRLRPIQRALVPMRRRTASDRSPTRTVEAWVVSRLDRTAAITLAGVAKGAEKAQTQEYLTSLRPLFDGREIAVRVLDDDDPSRAIVAEAARGYDVVVVGAPEGRSTGDGVFSRVIDDVVRGASCATVVVRGAGYEGHFPPKRILVPVSGSAASQAAAEFAALIAGADVAVDLLQIVVPSNELTGQRSDREVDAARQFLEHLATTCELPPDRSTQTVRVETDVEAAVLAAAANADLLVLGASVLPGTAQLYLGPRVGLFLERSPCPVLVVNS